MPFATHASFSLLRNLISGKYSNYLVLRCLYRYTLSFFLSLCLHHPVLSSSRRRDALAIGEREALASAGKPNEQRQRRDDAMRFNYQRQEREIELNVGYATSSSFSHTRLTARPFSSSPCATRPMREKHVTGRYRASSSTRRGRI